MSTAPMPPSGEREIRLLLVDDHALVRDGLRVRFRSEPGLRVVGEAGDAAAALIVAQREQPEVVLMDIGLKGVNGIDATRQLRAALPDVRVIILSMFDSPSMIREALHAGAVAYLLKDDPAEGILDCIRAVVRGQWQQLPLPGQAAAAPGADGGFGAALTPREREVLALIAEGLTSREIAQRLDMGVRTVETHRSHLRRKLDLPSPAALVRFAVQQQKR